MGIKHEPSLRGGCGHSIPSLKQNSTIPYNTWMTHVSMFATSFRERTLYCFQRLVGFDNEHLSYFLMHRHTYVVSMWCIVLRVHITLSICWSSSLLQMDNDSQMGCHGSCTYIHGAQGDESLNTNKTKDIPFSISCTCQHLLSDHVSMLALAVSSVQANRAASMATVFW